MVHCVPWGRGEKAVLDYLARYAFRIAITNHRIQAMDEASVTFGFKERKKRRWRSCRLSGKAFMRRFLQHVLPRGFHKIRYFGLWHPAKRDIAARLRLLLGLEHPAAAVAPLPDQDTETTDPVPMSAKIHADAVCPTCKQGRLVLLQRIPRPSARAP